MYSKSTKRINGEDWLNGLQSIVCSWQLSYAPYSLYITPETISLFSSAFI